MGAASGESRKPAVAITLTEENNTTTKAVASQSPKDNAAVSSKLGAISGMGAGLKSSSKRKTRKARKTAATNLQRNAEPHYHYEWESVFDAFGFESDEDVNDFHAVHNIAMGDGSEDDTGAPLFFYPNIVPGYDDLFSLDLTVAQYAHPDHSTPVVIILAERKETGLGVGEVKMRPSHTTGKSKNPKKGKPFGESEKYSLVSSRATEKIAVRNTTPFTYQHLVRFMRTRSRLAEFSVSGWEVQRAGSARLRLS